MKLNIIFLAALLLTGFTGIVAWSTRVNDDFSHTPANRDSLVRRGKYLVTIMGCNDCHTPKIMTPQGPVPDPDRLLSGHPAEGKLPPFDKTYTQSWVLFSLGGTAMAGPWGTSYAANITSDKTGLGNWTFLQFRKAMREGKYMGLDQTRTILPPMPWQSYASINDDDLNALFIYLKSTKPVKNIVPEPLHP